MVARATTVAFLGLNTHKVDVQAHMGAGMPSFQIVGLPDKGVDESRERVRSALQSIGIALPSKRIIVNLAPADLRKTGSHYDLPIALALLFEMKILPQSDGDGAIALGELSLDAHITSVPGVLPASLFASHHDYGVICPHACGQEARFAGDHVDILAPDSLIALVNHWRGTQTIAPPQLPINSCEQKDTHPLPDFVDIKGQEDAKYAIEIAASGGHHMLMVGSPGAGKSMLASRLHTILPPLSSQEALEVSMIHSLAGTMPKESIVTQRPYRAPHHSASLPSLIGGDKLARPGEVSLCHRGVLFLDELPEFSRSTLEALRQPIESGFVLVARAKAHCHYPAQFQLIAAMNPCPCGYHGSEKVECSCTKTKIRAYQNRISGPLYDRIDLYVDVPELNARELIQPTPSQQTNSTTIAKRVAQTRQLQQERFRTMNLNTLYLNAQADGKILEEIAPLGHKESHILADAIDTLKLSARSYHKVLRLARTLCDMDTQDMNAPINKYHIAHALNYRRKVLHKV
ncbi:MAG: YifB family Mg chelatase-like AAA ATPase [Alphaproteobacteria bacterium GM7ARS4]|nr:YifB family Mg chelatase-like AAA ATPase [Alphaproteobacteria bacterium GM7ARS4]